MNRFVLAVALVCSFAGFGAAEAQCVVAGPADSIYVKIGNVEILAVAFGNPLSGPAMVCADGTAEIVPTEGYLSISVDDVEVCRRPDHVSADPFGFSLSIHATGGSCGADVSVGHVKLPTANEHTVTGAYPPHPGMLGTGLLFPSPATGTYWLNGGPVETLPAGHLAWYTRGAFIFIN